MSEETFFTLVLVCIALIILLQLMAIISWWRRGSKYARLEIARREQMARGELVALSKPSEAKFTDWDIQADLDDPPLDEPPVREKPK